MGELARQVQHVTGQTVKLAFADQGYTGDTAAQAARDEGMELQVIKLLKAKKASYCCRVAGWSNAVSAGSTASGDWRAITSVCPRPSPACISLYSPCLCSFMPCRLSKVPNTL